MNREILFRGKRELDGKWIYGLYSDDYVYETEFPCIMPLRSGDDCEDWSVIRETVGQYTGLTDKNGNRIFEGDICKHRSNYSGNTIISVVTYTDGHFLALVCENSGFELSEKLEVIGNIHDNSELLEVQNDTRI